MNGYLYQFVEEWDSFDGGNVYGKLTTKDAALKEALEYYELDSISEDLCIYVYQIKDGAEKRMRKVSIHELKEIKELKANLEKREAEKQKKKAEEREQRILNNNPQSLSEIAEHLRRFGIYGNRNTDEKGDK